MGRASLGWIPLALAFAGCGSNASRNPRSFNAAGSPDLTVCPPGGAVLGMDVSNYQGSAINWEASADAGASFGIAKATEGLTVKDADFAVNWAQMKDAGVVRGAYHFFHPQDDGATQADDYLKMVGTLGEPGDLPPVLDWELDDTFADGGPLPISTQIAEAQKFIDEIKAKTGLDTIIYTYPDFWEGLGSPAQFAIHPLWEAYYPNSGLITSCPNVLAPWTTYAMWQYAGDVTSTTTPRNPFPGVSGEDLNVFNGSSDQLRGWSTPPVAQVSGNDALSAVNWMDQHVEIFGRSPAGDALHLSTSGTTDSWSATSSLGTGVTCGSAAAFWGPPGLYPELFAPLTSGQSGDFFYSGNSWNPEQQFGGEGLSSFSTVVGMDGQVRVFALGADTAIWLNSWSVSGHAFSGWSSLGGTFATGAAAITWGNGTIELFATDSNNVLWHSNTDSTQASGWTAWAQLGTGIASRPVAVRWADGTIGHAEVFARGTDGQLYHLEFSLSSGWPAPSVVSAGTSIIGVPSAMMNPSGAAVSGAEVVARDATGRVLHLQRSGAAYTDFVSLGDQLAASDPFGWIRADGSAEVFAVDMSGNLVRTLRDTSGTWGAWSAIGSGFDPCAPPLSVDGGVDAGSEDAGSDAGDEDGGDGGDGGIDGGRDAGTADAGVADAGDHDGGSDAGSISSAPSGGCSGGSTTPSGLLGIALVLCLLRRRRERADL